MFIKKKQQTFASDLILHLNDQRTDHWSILGGPFPRYEQEVGKHTFPPVDKVQTVTVTT